MSAAIHKRFLYSGRVQGVGFRYSVKQIAAGYEVVGWVRNLPDGRVEMQVSGQPTEVEAFGEAVTTSHLADHIRHWEQVAIDPPQHGSKGFDIRR